MRYFYKSLRVKKRDILRGSVFYDESMNELVQFLKSRFLILWRMKDYKE